MRCGEVWWADLPQPKGRRPVLLLSRDEAYAIRDLVIAGAVTTRVRDIPAEVALDKEEGMPQRCVVNCDVIDTIRKVRLERRATALSARKIEEVEEALRFPLGMQRP